MPAIVGQLTNACLSKGDAVGGGSHVVDEMGHSLRSIFGEGGDRLQLNGGGQAALQAGQCGGKGIRFCGNHFLERLVPVWRRLRWIFQIPICRRGSIFPHPSGHHF